MHVRNICMLEIYAYQKDLHVRSRRVSEIYTFFFQKYKHIRIYQMDLRNVFMYFQKYMDIRNTLMHIRNAYHVFSEIYYN